jgi:heme oxygenase
MIDRLNEATHEHHADAEVDFDVLFEDETTARHYMMFLVRAYGFEAPLELMSNDTDGLSILRRGASLAGRSSTCAIVKPSGFLCDDYLCDKV